MLYRSAWIRSVTVPDECVSFPSNPCRWDRVWGLIIARAISRVTSILSKKPPYRMLMVLPLSTRILDTRQLSMSMVTIKASLYGKCTTKASASKNEIGLLGVRGGHVSTVGYFLLRASLMWMAFSLAIMPSIGKCLRLHLFPMLDQSPVDLTLLLRSLLLHFGLWGLPGVEDKLLKIPSVY